MSCKTCNTNCIEAGTRDDQMCSAWTKRDDADMGNYFAKLAKVQTNISGTETAKQTNADRIRSMTDEELAKWLGTRGHECPERWKACNIGIVDHEDDCIPCWLKWLKEEVKE